MSLLWPLWSLHPHSCKSQLLHLPHEIVQNFASWRNEHYTAPQKTLQIFSQPSHFFYCYVSHIKVEGSKLPFFYLPPHLIYKEGNVKRILVSFGRNSYITQSLTNISPSRTIDLPSHISLRYVLCTSLLYFADSYPQEICLSLYTDLSGSLNTI